MSLVVAVLLTLSVTSGTAQAEHAEYIRVHSEWVRLHETTDSQAQLVFDPREGAMWIENHGEIDEGFAVGLQQGLRWYAFHVTQNGVVERSFPIRLIAPRAEIEDEAQEETLLVIAVGDGQGQQFSFSAARSAIGFHVGSNMIRGDVTCHLPALLDAQPPKYKSFLAPQSPRLSKAKEAIKKKLFGVRIKRRTTAPNAE